MNTGKPMNQSAMRLESIEIRSLDEFSQTDWISRFPKSIKWPNTYRSARMTSKTYFSNKKAGHLPIACLKQNYFLRVGGGVYLAVINANDGEIVDKIDVVDAYDASDMERFL